MTLETISAARSFGGTQCVYRHQSRATGTPMTFSLYLPPQATGGTPLPVLYFLSGLTCTHANVTEKGGYQRVCAELGLILVAPDTSPRGEEVADDDAYDLGQGAGFYVDATEAPFETHYGMYSYMIDELPELIGASFPADPRRASLTGHSMGGHGALTIALKNPSLFRSVSAFAPIVAPSRVPWGEKALAAYLGSDRAAWRRHDAVALIEDGARVPEILVDQGTSDSFLERELKPELLAEACAAASIPLTLRMQQGYDHSYYFISTFMEDHLRWHMARLLA
ncbi:S-formylglutathione hydrolase [Sphingosinicella rhizophila]|uniref:S-formylglutathione hydrolase n=1 Tax=Sphingosinicella rhizophila TaxID=3050082 RepID=A0ABU3QBL8_9SPHN|nr:S-formylglutathione hydrolase [Sphingosinicella sp. GR2756]MDT9600798.1 S-formylglutathione hydrolase [Sphingosinicella sp. GR2756]